jgi:uncharacterized repeat protein (TIGR03809 family)
LIRSGCVGVRFSPTGWFMTHRSDVTRGRDIVARWCALAERRLEYLTELFETGRWRRFHSEVAFLENFREAKSAVETWRDLLTREAYVGNSAVDMSRLGRTRAATPPRGQTMHNQARRLSPAPIAEPSPRPIVVMSAKTDRVSSNEAPSVPAMEMPALGGVAERLPDVDAIERRYPLLRNTL